MKSYVEKARQKMEERRQMKRIKLNLIRANIKELKSDGKIKYANAKGSEAKRTTYAYQSRKLYVCVPDYDSVAKISKKIKKLLKAKKATMSSKSVDQQPISDTTGGTD